MLTRILTSIVGIVVFLGVIFSPPVVLYVALFIVCAGMLYETYRVIDAKRELQVVGLIAEIIMFAGFFADKIGLAFYGTIFLFVACLVFFWGKCNSKDVLTTGMATLFITSAILSLVMLRRDYDGVYMLLLPFIIAWLSDTGAYFTGYFLGKHKLCPKMSPKKTVEGAVGGIVFAGVATAIYLGCVNGFEIGYIGKTVLVGCVGSVISQIGDLAASCIKRDYQKKDYGSLLPGHGGLMDRFDSVLFSAPYALLVLTYFGI